jgi:hypothetical protein
MSVARVFLLCVAATVGLMVMFAVAMLLAVAFPVFGGEDGVDVIVVSHPSQ